MVENGARCSDKNIQNSSKISMDRLIKVYEKNVSEYYNSCQLHKKLERNMYVE